MKNEIEQLIFEKMKAKDFGESMCNETKLNVLKWTVQQLRKHAVSGSLPLKVCTGCGWRSDKEFESKTAIACCPDNNYIELDEYLKNSVYRRQ